MPRGRGKPRSDPTHVQGDRSCKIRSSSSTTKARPPDVPRMARPGQARLRHPRRRRRRVRPRDRQRARHRPRHSRLEPRRRQRRPAALEDLAAFHPDIVAIMVTGFANLATPLDAMRMGVRDYLDKNHDLNRETLLKSVRKQLDRIRPAKRHAPLHQHAGRLPRGRRADPAAGAVRRGAERPGAAARRRPQPLPLPDAGTRCAGRRAAGARTTTPTASPRSLRASTTPTASCCDGRWRRSRARVAGTAVSLRAAVRDERSASNRRRRAWSCNRSSTAGIATCWRCR